MFKVTDIVRTTRDVRAGLKEDGPKICESNAKGVVINIQSTEPDGIRVELADGIKWWFKPNQLEIVHE